VLTLWQSGQGRRIQCRRCSINLVPKAPGHRKLPPFEQLRDSHRPLSNVVFPPCLEAGEIIWSVTELKFGGARCVHANPYNSTYQSEPKEVWIVLVSDSLIRAMPRRLHTASPAWAGSRLDRRCLIEAIVSIVRLPNVAGSSSCWAKLQGRFSQSSSSHSLTCRPSTANENNVSGPPYFAGGSKMESKILTRSYLQKDS